MLVKKSLRSDVWLTRLLRGQQGGHAGSMDRDLPFNKVHGVSFVSPSIRNDFTEQLREHSLDNGCKEREPLECVCKRAHPKAFDDNRHPEVLST